MSYIFDTPGSSNQMSFSHWSVHWRLMCSFVVSVQQPWNIKSGTTRSLTKTLAILFTPFNHTFMSTWVNVHQRRSGRRRCSCWEPVAKLERKEMSEQSPLARGVTRRSGVYAAASQSKSFQTHHTELETVSKMDAWAASAPVFRDVFNVLCISASNCQPCWNIPVYCVTSPVTSLTCLDCFP